MTYTINGSSAPSSSTHGNGVYHANINQEENVAILNPGGPFNGESIRSMQSNVDQDTTVYLDGHGHDRGDTVDIWYDSTGCEEDTVVIDTGDFAGDFCLRVCSMQSIDKLYMSNVVTFKAMDAHGNLISPVYSQDNVYGNGETGDQNGDEFGDGTYQLHDTGDGCPAYYQICYIDRNGDEQTIIMSVDVADGDHSTIAINFICFGRGTLIECQDGMKRVEDLKPGDLVRTKDNGFQALQWIASRKLSGAEVKANPQIRPIKIKAGALGENMPAQDLSVSPQHRMLVSDWRCEAMFGEDEMLVPAKALINDSSVTVDHGAEEVEYFHFMFEQHEIVYANGVESESFHPGDFGLSTLDGAALTELFQVFPHLEQDVNAFGAPARPVLRAFEAHAMLQA